MRHNTHLGEPRPTVLMLYTGGMIDTSVNDDSSRWRGLRMIDSPRHDLIQRFHQRIVRYYTQLYGAGVEMPFELIWEILPSEKQLFSENADTSTWNDLATALERICHKYVHGPQQLKLARDLNACPKLFEIFEEERKNGISQEQFLHQVLNRYITGVVVLHGTDTLAYSAAALSFSLENLPFPIVLTGSNQPPNEDSILEQDLVASESDAWKNILHCLLFLHTFGHRFTEVFVCFGETIHHAMNLRKMVIGRIPIQPESELRSIKEQCYVYRNQGPQRPYIYRYIDGLYCNNFSPLQGGWIPSALLYEARRYRHARLAPLHTEMEIRRFTFSSNVRLVSVSPSFLSIDWGQCSAEMFQEWTQGLEVLVVEGYNSGTFSTWEGDPFTSLLKLLLRESIPIVLISRDGSVPSQEPYKTQKVDGQEVPVLRLFSVIAETALPLVSLVFHNISEEEWAHKENEEPTALLRRRLELLEHGIRNRLSRPNILQVVLGSILDESQQRHWRSAELRQEELANRNRTGNLFAQAHIKVPRKQSERSGGLESFSSAVTILLPRSLWHFCLETVHLFESGPDGFAFINEKGFNCGQRLLESLISGKQRENDLPLIQQAEDAVQSLTERAQSFTRHIGTILYQSGVAADIREIDLTVEAPRDPVKFSDGLSFLEIRVLKDGLLTRSDELFADIGHQDKEAELFHRLREGHTLTQSEQLYQELFATGWDAQISSLDWFLIGIFKAVLCGVLRDLLFDPWVQSCNRDNPKYINALRQSITTTVILASRHLLHIRFDYRARTILAPPE